MDPVSIAASAVVSALAPYLRKAADKLAEKAGEAGWKKAAELYDALKQRFAGGTPAGKALEDLAQAPDDADNQGDLRKRLREAFAADPDWMREMADLAARCGAGGGDVNFNNQIAGDVENLTQIGTATNVHIGKA
jgi:hypothetical protein